MARPETSPSCAVTQPLCVVGAEPDQPVALAAREPRIAAPAFARRHRVEMRVQQQPRSRGVADLASRDCCPGDGTSSPGGGQLPAIDVRQGGFLARDAANGDVFGPIARSCGAAVSAATAASPLAGRLRSRSATIIVPQPSLVKISYNSVSGVAPLTMCARCHAPAQGIETGRQLRQHAAAETARAVPATRSPRCRGRSAGSADRRRRRARHRPS